VKRLFVISWGPLGLAFALSATASAQTTAPAVPAVPARPPAADLAVDPSSPNSRVTIGQAPVVGGNAAGARERALEDAIRQAVDLIINEIVVDPQARAAQGKTLRAIEAKAHGFIGRYRTLEEGEANGVYTMRVQVEVDRSAIQSKIDRGAAPPSPSTPPRAATPAIVVLPGDQTPPVFVANMVAALSSAGLHARAGDPLARMPPSMPQSMPLAAAATVTAETVDEGALRGTGRVSVACRATARFTGVSLPDRVAAVRAFAEAVDAGRTDCLGRLASALAGEVASALTAAVSPSADLPLLTIDADVVEPGAVPALLKSVRSVGMVSAADLVRVGAGHAEIRARTRSGPAPLAAALSRAADAMISLSDVQASGAVIKLRVRLRAPAAPETGNNP
jgi:hypothetical protein